MKGQASIANANSFLKTLIARAKRNLLPYVAKSLWDDNADVKGGVFSTIFW